MKTCEPEIKAILEKYLYSETFVRVEDLENTFIDVVNYLEDKIDQKADKTDLAASTTLIDNYTINLAHKNVVFNNKFIVPLETIETIYRLYINPS